MKSVFVSGLPINEVVTTQFLVLQKEVRQKKTSEPYLTLRLGDKTGEVEAKMWDNVAEVLDTFEQDDFVKVKGIVQIYQQRTQLTVHKLRRLGEHEVTLADFFACSARDPQVMYAELCQCMDGIGNLHLRDLLRLIFSDPELVARFQQAPAATSYHHAYRGGLLEHVLSLCQLCRVTAAHFGAIDLDLLLTGAILHDIGKVTELKFDRSLSYSTQGQLIGHIVLGVQMIGEAAAKVPDFPPRLLALLEHMVLSHHGELEYGSPKVPLFKEALLFHFLDNMDSKMEAARVALERDSLVGSEFTPNVRALNRPLLRTDQYLADPPQTSEAKPPLEERAKAPEGTGADREGHGSTPAANTKSPGAPSTLFGEKLSAVLNS